MAEMFLADFSPIGIILFILYSIYSVAKANKKAKEKQGKRKPSRPASGPKTSQPGKSIDDILRELERRVEGKVEPKPSHKPQTAQAKDVAWQNEKQKMREEREKTIEDFKKERHSTLYKHHQTVEKMNDGKFDDIDHRLMHMEEFEIEAHKPTEEARFNPEDLRKAVIWQAILNRPYAD